MRLAVVFTKEAPVRFVSHLDVQRLFQRAFRRAKLPLAYSQGFNPHPLVAFATALSVGFTSCGEYLDVTLTKDIAPEEFIERVGPELPEGVRIVEAFDISYSRKSLTSAMRSAKYSARAEFDKAPGEDAIRNAVSELLSSEIVVMKRTKGGIKPVDIRPMLISFELVKAEADTAVFAICGVLSAEGGLNPDTLLNVLFEKLGVTGTTDVSRLETVLDREALA